MAIVPNARVITTGNGTKPFLPKRLRITGLDWMVEESEDTARQGDVYGATHFVKQKIFIRPDMTDQYKAETLLHEILHICIDQSGLSERLTRVKDTVTEEEIIRAISTQLYQVLRENELRF